MNESLQIPSDVSGRYRRLTKPVASFNSIYNSLAGSGLQDS